MNFRIDGRRKTMTTLYAFLWHVNCEEMNASEGASGSRCESAEAERQNKKEAKKALETWLAKRQKACKDSGCEHTPIITTELTLKMIMSGMTANMVKI